MVNFSSRAKIPNRVWLQAADQSSIIFVNIVGIEGSKDLEVYVKGKVKQQVSGEAINNKGGAGDLNGEEREDKTVGQQNGEIEVGYFLRKGEITTRQSDKPEDFELKLEHRTLTTEDQGMRHIFQRRLSNTL